LKDILSGNQFTQWTTGKNSISELRNAQYLLTNFVRANRLMPWVLANFEFKFKPIVLVRHPIARALSQLNTFSHLKNKQPGFIVLQINNNDIYKENEHYLNSLNSLSEQKVALWCINNINTLSDLNVNKKTIRVYYEHLLLDPKNELTKIFNDWGLDLIIKQTVLRKESSTTTKQGLPTDIMLQLNKWQNTLDDDMRKKIQSYLIILNSNYIIQMKGYH